MNQFITVLDKLDKKFNNNNKPVWNKHFKDFLNEKLDKPKSFGLTRWFELPDEVKVEEYIRKTIIN